MAPIGSNGVQESLASFLEASQVNGKSQMLNSNMAKFKGNKHAQGGIQLDSDLDGSIDTEVEGEEVIREDRVYSDRLKATSAFIDHADREGIRLKGGTYANISEQLGKLKGLYEDKLETQVDEAAINTAELMLPRVEQLLDIAYNEQELRN